MSIIQIHDLSYIHADRETLFRQVGFSVLSRRKVALIGDNGSGKSTLLKIIAGEARPASGEVAVSEKPYYIPQHFGQYDHLTIVGALGVEAKLDAIQAITSGDCSEEHYTALQDDWTVEERARTALDSWGLIGFMLDRPMSELSGGEKTKVFLAGVVLHEPGIILMDEPSNHLDAPARERLYRFVTDYPATMVVVSHDRTLLNRLDTMIELHRDGVTVYGGNYEFYKEQKEGQLAALQGQVDEKAKALRVAEKTARQAAERKERLDARGSGKMKKEGTPRIMLKIIADGAAASAKKLKETHTEKQEQLAGELRALREKVPENRDIKIKVSDSALHRGKALVVAEGINYAYGETPLWAEPFSFRIESGERVRIEGANGAGKSTLLRLILGELEPTGGSLFRADFRSLYVDQEYALVDNDLTLYEQVERFNTRHLPEHEVKTELHRFLFPAATWDKLCGTLSGGEKMKLIFCCLLISDSMPDLFVLDEPTNNLDIKSLEIVTHALRSYQGTLLVISHDHYFAQEIGIERSLALPEKRKSGD